MDTQTFLDNFATIAGAPGGVEQLRTLILSLAVRGQLVSSEPGDEPASVLLDRIAIERGEREASGELSRTKPIRVHEAPYEIPPSWEWAAIATVAHLEMGQSPPSSNYNQVGDGIPFFQGKADFGNDHPTARYWCTKPTKRATAGDVLLSVRAPVGPTNLATEDCCIGRGLARLRPLGGMPSRWILIVLRAFEEALAAKGTGTTFVAVSKKIVEPIPFPVPPLNEQHRIVAKVHGLMQLCDDLEARQQAHHGITTRLRASSLDVLTNAETDDDLHTAWSRIHANWEALTDDLDSINVLRQTIRQLAVRGKLVEQVLTDEPAAELIQRSIAALRLKSNPTALGGEAAGQFPVPAPWTWADLQSLCRTQTGATPKKEHLDADGTTVSYVAPAQIGAGEVDETNLIPRSAAESTRRLAPPRSVLFVGIGGGIGKCGLSTRETTFNQQIHAASPVEANADYLAIVVASPSFQTEVRVRTSATAIPIINKTKWVTIPIPVPPLDEQKRIAQRVTTLMGYCDRLESQLAEREQCAEHVAGCIGGLSFAEVGAPPT